MTTYLENLITRRDAISAELALITSSKTSSSVGGQSENHDQHRTTLLNELKELNLLIASPMANNNGTPIQTERRHRI